MFLSLFTIIRYFHVIILNKENEISDSHMKKMMVN
jgi:hypothetical protein